MISATIAENGRIKAMISREEAIKWLESLKSKISETQYQSLWHYEQALVEIIEALSQPERPKGRWIRKTGIFDGYSECSECAEIALTGLNFCPNCGADMRGEEE